MTFPAPYFSGLVRRNVIISIESLRPLVDGFARAPFTCFALFDLPHARRRGTAEGFLLANQSLLCARV